LRLTGERYLPAQNEMVFSSHSLAFSEGTNALPIKSQNPLMVSITPLGESTRGESEIGAVHDEKMARELGMDEACSYRSFDEDSGSLSPLLKLRIPSAIPFPKSEQAFDHEVAPASAPC
jgi:hypothetical protein